MKINKKKIAYIILAGILILAGLWIDRNQEPEQVVASSESIVGGDENSYYFRNENLLKQHYEKHGMEMGFDSMEDYEQAAGAVVYHPDVLTKVEEEDGDYVYYIEESNEFVVISQDGYIRTYFYPDDGIDYFNRQ